MLVSACAKRRAVLASAQITDGIPSKVQMHRKSIRYVTTPSFKLRGIEHENNIALGNCAGRWNNRTCQLRRSADLPISVSVAAISLSGYPAQGQYPSPQYPSQGYPAQGYPSQNVYVGTVDRIELINRGTPNNMAGTLIGGVVGGLIGSQIGHGTGRTVATVAGVAGGAYVGNQIEQRRRAPKSHFAYRYGWITERIRPLLRTTSPTCGLETGSGSMAIPFPAIDAMLKAQATGQANFHGIN